MSKQRRIGPYEVLSELGRGGMGVVYRARDTRLPREVALKLFSRPLAATPADLTEALVRFQREVEVLAQLRHRHVVRVHDKGQADDGCPFLVMDLVSGGSLADLVRSEGPLEPDQVVTLLRQLCQAVSAAHEVGVLHRDIKPENVLVGETGDALLTDFGLATATDDERLTETGTVIGTPAYMSPEQARGDRAQMGPASDVYALGALAYYLLSGQPPFRGRTVVNVLQAVLSKAPTPLALERPGLPAWLIAIVDRCLEKDPQDRFSSAGELEQALASRHEPPKGLSHKLIWALPLVGVVVGAAFAAAWSTGEESTAASPTTSPASPTPTASADPSPPAPTSGPSAEVDALLAELEGALGEPKSARASLDDDLDAAVLKARRGLPASRLDLGLLLSGRSALQLSRWKSFGWSFEGDPRREGVVGTLLERRRIPLGHRGHGIGAPGRLTLSDCCDALEEARQLLRGIERARCALALTQIRLLEDRDTPLATILLDLDSYREELPGLVDYLRAVGGWWKDSAAEAAAPDATPERRVAEIAALLATEPAPLAGQLSRIQLRLVLGLDPLQNKLTTRLPPEQLEQILAEAERLLALPLQPHLRANALVLHAQTAELLGLPWRARISLDEAVELNNSSDAKLARSHFRAGLGDRVGAKADLKNLGDGSNETKRKIHALVAGRPRRQRERLDEIDREAAALVNAGDLDAALRVLDQGRAIRPRSAEFYLTRARVLKKAGRQAEAMAEFNLAVEMAPDDVREIEMMRGWLQQDE